MLARTLLNAPSRALMPAAPRILVYGLNYAPEVMGVGRYTGELATYLSEAGADVDVVTAPPHYPHWKVDKPFSAWRYRWSRENSVGVTRCPILLKARTKGFWRLLTPLSFAISSAPVMLARALFLRPTVIVAVEPTLFVAPLALACAWLVGAKSLLHVQDMEVEAAFSVGHLSGNWLSRLGRAFDRAVVRRFDHVVSISRQMCALMEKKGVAQARVSLVRNWIDIEKVSAYEATAAGMRREIGLSPEDFLVLYAGSIGAKQGLDILLSAASGLQQNKSLVFVVAGDGPTKPALVENYGHLPNVRFLPPQSEPNYRALLCGADLHVLPQIHGAGDLFLPSKLGAVLASGKPAIVAADENTELFDFLADAACLVPPGDTSALQAAILRGLDEGFTGTPEERRKRARAFDARTNLSRFASIAFALARQREAGAFAVGGSLSELNIALPTGEGHD
jgi:colanic acid biosynthesis glycosyl transferase WcaI